jgi:hypothetical protein
MGVEHISSIEQHLVSDPTNVGVEVATVSAIWRPTRHTYIEVQDGYIFNGAYFAGRDREIFEARAGVALELKP